jgi:predicted TIM-barrel fold metal-dependent hydrolase
LTDVQIDWDVPVEMETTIAVERLIVTGALDRNPKLRLLIVHAGGYMPWQAGACATRPPVRRVTTAA